uniref:Uncharacterized protein n=1 Tax=Rhizophora mucronata TaxID=61149 RepID=A0A2P2N931_RHIMU
MVKKVLLATLVIFQSYYMLMSCRDFGYWTYDVCHVQKFKRYYQAVP